MTMQAAHDLIDKSGHAPDAAEKSPSQAPGL